jgi:mevalonate kinase
MQWSKFSTQVPGKWVLAGEHSVLRGATAVALPHPQFTLKLSFDPSASRDFQVDPPSSQALMDELITSIADAWENQGKSFTRPKGKLTLESDIPIGAGLGSSAALCVAMTRWVSDPLSIPSSESLEFATQLEHRFHGRSSGMDVAVIASNEPISFVMGRGVKFLGIKKLPHFTFHDTGVRTRTSECVLRVEKFREEDPALAIRVDDSMGSASRIAMEGLIQYDRGQHEEGLRRIQSAMMQARECFYSWELVPGVAQRMEEDLLKQGALAVKLTGAGGGGVLVALWPNSEYKNGKFQ